MKISILNAVNQVEKYCFFQNIIIIHKTTIICKLKNWKKIIIVLTKKHDVLLGEELT